MTSRKNDPSLAQELEKERTRPLEEAERRGPRKPKTNGRTLTPVKNGARSHGKSEYARGVAMMKKNAGAHTLPGLVVRRNKHTHTHTHTQTHIIFIGNLKSGEQSAKIYQGGYCIRTLGATCILRPDNSKDAGVRQARSDEGIQGPAYRGVAWVPVGMEEIAAACGDPRNWFHPYHRLNEAASMPGGSGPPNLTKSRTFTMTLVLEL